MVKAGQKITLSASRDIPFNKLSLSQSNVRRLKAGVSIEDLAEDVARRGLLQSLNVRPVLDAAGAETGMFEIPAGGRRYRALERLVKQKRLSKTAPIPCIVRDPAVEVSAEEDSLAENVQRVALHPLDQFRAFKALCDRGTSVEEIAARFFVPPAIVKQRLRLAAVSERLLGIYAEDGMTLEQLMAFTVTTDHARQEQVWEALQQSYDREPYLIRRQLTESAVRASDRRARFVGVEAYEAAGGLLLRDLFEDDGGGWLQDVARLDRLATEMLAVEAEKIATEGWKWIEVAVDFRYGHAHLRIFTRELMADVERDLGTRLDWVAVDHWNTDNPHVHVLIRGKAEDGQDLVISRAYISRGFRDRAAERVTLELGPRTEREIRSALENEVNAERWTGLDRALRNVADAAGGVADLRPGTPDEDPELRRLMLGRARKLERLGLVDQIGPASWTLKPGLEQSLRGLSIRGDIIKTMHKALTVTGREPDIAGFALHGDAAVTPVLGRLVARGLHDELKGSAYAVVEGVDGRTHHLQFSDLEMTGDAQPGAIVEARSYEDANGRRRLSLATRSDLPLEAQICSSGATWIDRQLLAREAATSGNAFGREVREAMDRRVDHLAEQGLARRQGQRVVFARNLLNTLRQRELYEASAKLAAETGLVHRPSAEGEHVAGLYRRRVTLSSGRFAMIDDGLGFQLVPWRPALERHLGRQVTGAMSPGGTVDWSFRPKRGLSV